MVTVYDVARATGLSIASVSRALNGQQGVSQRTAERIIAVADELGYHRNDVARSLVAKSTQTVALLLPDITNPFFPELVKGVQDVADREDRVLLLADGADDPRKIASNVAVLRRRQVDGIVVVAGTLDEDADALFHGLPFVFLDRRVNSAGASVAVDHEAGAYAGTRHLIELGHREIGHVAGPAGLEVSAQRQAGWRRACLEAGLGAGDHLVAPGDFLESGGHAAGAALLDANPGITAIFAANDLSAIGLLALCAERGIAVPEELSIVGFDGIQLAHYTSPVLTTVAQPIVELGRRAGELLLDVIDDRGIDTHLELPTSLRRGASTGPADGRDR